MFKFGLNDTWNLSYVSSRSKLCLLCSHMQKMFSEFENRNGFVYKYIDWNENFKTVDESGRSSVRLSVCEILEIPKPLLIIRWKCYMYGYDLNRFHLKLECRGQHKF